MRECSPPSTCHMSCVTCPVSRVTCHVSRVMCHMSQFFYFILFFFCFEKVLKIIGGGSVINGAYPIKFSFFQIKISLCFGVPNNFNFSKIENHKKIIFTPFVVPDNQPLLKFSFPNNCTLTLSLCL